MVSAEVMFASDLLRCRYCPQYVPRDRIAARVASLGYAPPSTPASTEPDRRGAHDLLLRARRRRVPLDERDDCSAWWSTPATSRPSPRRRAAYVPFLLMALATPGVFYCAWPILRSPGLGAARRRAPHGVAARTRHPDRLRIQRGAGVHRRTSTVYFDTACAIVTLVLTGKALERGAKDKTAASSPCSTA